MGDTNNARRGRRERKVDEMGRASGGTRSIGGPGGAPRSRRYWTDDRIEAELASLLEGRDTWPLHEEFAAYGLRGLAMAVSRYGGISYWAERMGVRLGTGQNRSHYTEYNARLDTEEVIGRLGFLPNVNRIRAEGFGRLASFINRRGGGVRAWLEHIERTDPPSPCSDGRG